MNKNKFERNIILFLSLVLLIFSTESCEDDPVTPQQEHFEAIGMIFYSSGIEEARILRGITSDTLIAPLDTFSTHIDIRFFDENENIIDPPTTGQTLAWEFNNPSMVEVKQHEGEEGSFEFHLKGLLIGETEVEFFIMHNDHQDYRSGKIPVRVEK